MNLTGHVFELFARSRNLALLVPFAAMTFSPRVAAADVSWIQGEAPIEANHELPHIRADANLDGQVDIADPIYVLFGLFSAGSELLCEDAADANDDGSVDFSDPIFTLRYLFGGGPAPREPFPNRGADETPDQLRCRPLPTVDRWIFTIRPRLCPEGECDPWMTPGDEPTPDGHLAAFSRWAKAGGANITRAWTEPAPSRAGFDRFRIWVILASSTWVAEIVEVFDYVVLAPSGIYAIAALGSVNDSMLASVQSSGGEIVGTRRAFRRVSATESLDLWVVRGDSSVFAAVYAVHDSTRITTVFPEMVITAGLVEACYQNWRFPGFPEDPGAVEDVFVEFIRFYGGVGPGDYFYIVNPISDFDPYNTDFPCGTEVHWLNVLIPAALAFSLSQNSSFFGAWEYREFLRGSLSF